MYLGMIISHAKYHKRSIPIIGSPIENMLEVVLYMQ